eukprot:m.261151 g.261151  ORF g.261151 m.261151 type:complete len:326 (-) comp41403_c0_seq1:690-1667(-)
MHFAAGIGNLGNTTSDTRCHDSDATYHWVYEFFGECCNTDFEFTGFALGMISNLCWLAAQAPQLWKNYVNGKAESLSILFLAEWLTGDITNLAGCLLLIKTTTRTQLYTAIYFCIIDSMMVSQWIYYERKNRKPKNRGVQMNTLLAPIVLVATPMALMSLLYDGDGAAQSRVTVSDYTGHHGGSRVLLGHRIDATHDELVGYILAWICAILYFTSRIPQIVTNFRRKNCEGLSPVMFTMAVCGNLFYAAGALTNGGLELDIFLIRLPFLVGSVGTLLFDFTILMQYFCYGKGKNAIYEGDDALALIDDKADFGVNRNEKFENVSP